MTTNIPKAIQEDDAAALYRFQQHSEMLEDHEYQLRAVEKQLAGPA